VPLLLHANAFFVLSFCTMHREANEEGKKINVDVAFHCGQGQNEQEQIFYSRSSVIKWIRFKIDALKTPSDIFVIIYSENFIIEKKIYKKKSIVLFCQSLWFVFSRGSITKNCNNENTDMCKKNYFIWTIKSKYLGFEND
jgi:hypothetical protein